MYPTGWKYTDPYAATTTAISEFSTGLQAPNELIVNCEGFTWLLVSLGSTDNDTSSVSVQVHGTQTDGEAAQQINFCFNCLIATVSGNSNLSVSSVNLATPSGAVITSLSMLGVVGADSGINEVNGTAQIDTVHYWNRLAGNQTISGYIDTGEEARSGDSPDHEDLWLFNPTDGDASGPAWVAFPCGPFNYIQLEVSNAGDNGTSSVFTNLLA